MNLLTYDDLLDRGIHLSKVSLWRKERDGSFPRRLRLSHSRIAWVESEIDAWLQSRVKARPAVRVPEAA